jgi:hypothetical protein
MKVYHQITDNAEKCTYLEANNEAHSYIHTCCASAAKYCTVRDFVCSVRYLACSAHVPYCHLWPVRLYSTFPHYLINGKIFEENLLNIKCAFQFL